MKLAFTLAFRNLFRNPRRTFLTTLLIGFSLAALMFTDALIIGMSRVMVNAATHIWSGEIQVHERGFNEQMDVNLYLSNPEELVQVLEDSHQVQSWSERVMTTGMVSSSQNMAAALVYGIDPQKEARLSKLADAITKGNMPDAGNPQDIVVGMEMAEQLEAKLGDRLVLTASRSGDGELAQELFRLSGVFEFGIRELDELFVVINKQRAQEMLGLGNGVHEIAIRLEDPALARQVSFPLLTDLSINGALAESWPTFNSEISTVIEMSHVSILIVAAILFSLSALGVVNSMFMSIYERIYEFGVVRAIGTSPSQLFLTVMCEALILGIFSVILGCIIGGSANYIMSYTGLYMGSFEFSGVSFTDPIKTVVTTEQFIKYPFWVMVITLVSSCYPALFAARIVPSEALRRAL